MARAQAIWLEGEALVTRSASRDDAVAALARSAARRGFAIAYDLLGDRAESEDAVQEALARACESWERLRDPQALEGWFYRVLVNHCMRLLRRRRLSLAVRRLWGGPAVVVRHAQGGADPGDAEVDVIDQAPRADDRLGGARDQARVLAVVAGLAPMQRAALLLRYGHDLGVPEIAGMLGVGPGTVKTHLVRGLARLRDAMKETGHE